MRFFEKVQVQFRQKWQQWVEIEPTARLFYALLVLGGLGWGIFVGYFAYLKLTDDAVYSNSEEVPQEYLASQKNLMLEEVYQFNPAVVLPSLKPELEFYAKKDSGDTWLQNRQDRFLNTTRERLQDYKPYFKLLRPDWAKLSNGFGTYANQIQEDTWYTNKSTNAGQYLVSCTKSGTGTASEQAMIQQLKTIAWSNYALTNGQAKMAPALSYFLPQTASGAALTEDEATLFKAVGDNQLMSALYLTQGQVRPELIQAARHYIAGILIYNTYPLTPDATPDLFVEEQVLASKRLDKIRKDQGIQADTVLPFWKTAIELYLASSMYRDHAYREALRNTICQSAIDGASLNYIGLNLALFDITVPKFATGALKYTIQKGLYNETP